MAESLPLVEYGSSGEGSEEDAPDINYEESSKVLSSLREKFSMNITPSVRNKARKCVGLGGRYLEM